MRRIYLTERQLKVLSEAVPAKDLCDAYSYLEMNNIKYLYHATPSCYVSSIKRYGLGGKMPNTRFWDYNGTVYDGLTNGCFLSTDEYVAESYIESSDNFYELSDRYKERYNKDLNIVVFSVDVSTLERNLISFDENQNFDEGGEPTFFYNGVIPYNLLKVVEL